MKTAKTVTELLLEIRKRPGIYIGAPSLIRLRIYIFGYIHAMKMELGLECGDRVFWDFNEWLNRKYNIIEPIFWENSLTNISLSAAFDLFYKEFDAYLDTLK